MFFPTGGRGADLAGVYESKDLIDRLKEMEVIATQKENPPTKNTLTPADVNELFYEGDKLVWRHLDALVLGLPRDILPQWKHSHGITLDNPIRKFCVHAMLNKWFDRIILLAICGNALTLAADNPLDDSNDDIFIVMEYIFNVIFLIEFMMKIISLGGWGEESGYFRDPWNRLDCIVLICGWLPLFLAAFGVDGVNNFSFIRVIRILKILKTINTIPGLKRLVKAVLDAIPRLISVANLLTIIFFIFGILGTQLFQGALRRRCFPTNVTAGYVPEDDLCSGDGDLGALQCPTDTPVCSEYFPGSKTPNSNLNIYSNFDNTPVSFLTIFVVISLEGWSSVMFSIVETSGYTACVYFIVLVIIGAYFVINLVIAVIYQSYIETIEEFESHEISFRLLVKMDLEESLSPSGGAGGLGGGGLMKHNLARLPSRGAGGRLEKDREELKGQGQGEVGKGKKGFIVIRKQSSGESTSVRPRELRTQLTAEGAPHKYQLARQLTRQLSRQASHGVLMQRQMTRQLSRKLTRQMSRQPSVGKNINYFNLLQEEKVKTVSKRLYKRGLLPMGVHKFLTVDVNYLRFKKACQDIVARQAFDMLIVMVILFNVVILSIQANGSSEKNEYFVETSNVIITVFFCVEVIMHMVAKDIIPFIKSGYNILDLVIVLVSIVELSYGNASNSLSAFRTLRVFRTFKLFKRWESLQELIRAIFVSGEGLGYFSIVLLLFLFVFSLTGKSLFAGKLPTSSRANFDSMFISFVTTFQLVTGENWNEILFETMEFSPAIGGIFCILVYILGSLVVLNIFLAILLETFSNDEDNVDSYYDKLDSQSSFQNSIKKKWQRFTTLLNELYIKHFKKDEKESDLEREGEAVAKEEGNVLLIDTAQQVSFKRVSQGAKSKWIGWSDLDHGDSTVGTKFLNDDVWVRRVLSTICVGQFRRGGKIYSDCFTAAEVIDCLLDHEIVDNVKLAVLMGQELIFRKNLLPVYVELGDEFGRPQEEGSAKLMSPSKKDLQQVNREYASLLSLSVVDEVSESESGNESVSSVSRSDMTASPVPSPRSPSPSFPKRAVFFGDDTQPSLSVCTDGLGDDSAPHEFHMIDRSISVGTSNLRKLTSSIDAHFMDDNSLYRLNLQGEQVTEWLLNSKQSAKELKALKKQRLEAEKQAIMMGYSFGIFGPDNPLRYFCTTLVTHKYFEYVVLMVIVASSICLAIDEPDIETNSAKYRALKISDYCFTVFFILEMMIKLISKGAFGSNKSYFASGWNVLDFVIVVTSVISLVLVSSDLSYLKVFRALRSLRPLRVVSRSPALIAVVNAIIMVTTPLLNFALVICVFLFTFAILGTSLFRNKLFYCKAVGLENDNSNVESDEFQYVFDKHSCFGNTTNADGTFVTLEWTTRNSNFDNVASALLTLFELITMEAWPSIMYPAMDIPNHADEHPTENNSKYNALFFIVFIVFGAFFITNLFVGIIVYKFKTARETNHGSAMLTVAQQKWLDDIQVAMTAKPRRHNVLPDKNAMFGLKRPIHLFVSNEKFMFCMDMLIILNILVMSLEHFNQVAAISRFIFIMNEVFTALFTVEIVLRFLAVTPEEFWALKWNRMDAVIVFVALIDSAGGSIVFRVTLFRVFRVARLFRLIKDSKDLIVLVKTLYFSLPSLLNVGTLLFLSFFVFAVVGMNLFGGSVKDDMLFNDYANFHGFAPSMLLLFQCMTGENWNATMYLLKNQGYSVAVPFFACFLLVNKYILLNLFIAIILENFEAALKADPAKVAQRNLEDFIHEWSNIRKEIGSTDNDCMPSYCLVKILHSLDPPLGIRGTRESLMALRTLTERQQYRRYIMSLIRSLDLKEDSSGRVFFVDVVSALVRRRHATENGGSTSVVENMSIEQRHELLSQLRHLTRKKRISTLEKKMKNKVFTEIDLTVEVNAAMYIQAVWRGTMNRKRHREKIVFEEINKITTAPRIVLNRTDSKRLQAVMHQTPGTSGFDNVRKALKIIKLGSESFNFVQRGAVTFDEDVDEFSKSDSDREGDDEECSSCEGHGFDTNASSSLSNSEEEDDNDDFDGRKCVDSNEDLHKEYMGKFYQPRGVQFQPLELDSAPSVNARTAITTSASTATASASEKSEESSRQVSKKLLSLVRDASVKLTKFQTFAKNGASNISPASKKRLRRRSSSVDLNEIASSNDDFNYFTVFEDTDECLVLTHVNSQRHLMENLFTAQEKKKQEKKRNQLLRKQSTQCNVQVDLEEEFKDMDIYVLHPETTATNLLYEEDDYHL